MSSQLATPTDSDNKDSNHQHHSSWSPQSIIIDIGNGEKIDLMEAFCLPIGKRKADEPGIPLCPHRFPPVWDTYKEILKTIQRAAMLQAQTDLILGETKPKINHKIKIPFFTLICNRGRVYYPSNDAPYSNATGETASPNTPPAFQEFPMDVSPPQYKNGINNDNLVGQRKFSRGEEGRKKPKRSSTAKPPKGLECKFKIRVYLIPDEKWFVQRTCISNGSHNHLPQLNTPEMLYKDFCSQIEMMVGQCGRNASKMSKLQQCFYNFKKQVYSDLRVPDKDKHGTTQPRN